MDLDFSGEWHNQHGSSMELQQNANGHVTGTYTTASAAQTLRISLR